MMNPERLAELMDKMLEENRLKEQAAEIGNILVDKEFMKLIHQTTRLLVQSATEINNSITRIERHHAHADDKVIKTALCDLKAVSTGLSLTWDELALTLAANDLLEYSATDNNGYEFSEAQEKIWAEESIAQKTQDNKRRLCDMLSGFVEREKRLCCNADFCGDCVALQGKIPF